MMMMMMMMMILIACDVLTDDESVMSVIQLEDCLSSIDRDVITPRSRDHDDVTDDNVADWILDHSDVISGRKPSKSQATRCHRQISHNVRYALHFFYSFIIFLNMYYN